MILARKWSMSLAAIFGVAMVAALLSLLGSSPVEAASAPSVPRVLYDGVCGGPPWYTDPICSAGNAHPIIWDAHAESDSDGRASGQAYLQLETSSYELNFSRVEEVLLGADRNPVGAIMSGQVSTSENGDGETVSIVYAYIEISDGRCCTIEIQAPMLAPSTTIRFTAPGDLRFE